MAYIETELINGWLTLWLDRPDARNAMSQELVDELRAALLTAQEDSSIRGMTMRGRGDVFCAGGDIKGFQSIMQGGQSHADIAAANRDAGDLFELIEGLPFPVIMLVHGAAMAGGMGIACAGDVVIVTRDAKFALTETSIGIVPAQIAAFVVGRIGLSHARRLMLTAARFDGAEAVRMGLADFIADDMETAESIEADIRNGVMKCARHANAVTKKIVLATRTMPRHELLDFAAQGFAECMLGDEGREGVASFIEKRKPNWMPE